MSDMNELFKLYNLKLNENEIGEKVKKSIADFYENADKSATYKDLFSFLELTSLNADDTDESIAKWINRINKLDEKYPEIPKPAGICIYPNFVDIVKSTLTEDLQISSVVGFPSSQTFVEVKVAEAALSVMNGANEIDMVIPQAKLLAKDYEAVRDEIGEIKSASHGAKLKVIIETGNMPNLKEVYKASIIAMEAGADYIKTTTGKNKPSDLKSTYVMCMAIQDFYKASKTKIGLKPAGGIATKKDALMYYCVVKSVLGADWLNPTLFRIGASRLSNDLLSAIYQKEERYF